jgi:hypothetical protein
MASGTATSALEPIRVLYGATDRQPSQWRSLEGIGVAESPDAVRYALTRGWLVVLDGDRVCLTDSRRTLNQLIIRPLSRPLPDNWATWMESGGPTLESGDKPTRGRPPRRRPPI